MNHEKQLRSVLMKFTKEKLIESYVNTLVTRRYTVKVDDFIICDKCGIFDDSDNWLYMKSICEGPTCTQKMGLCLECRPASKYFCIACSKKYCCSLCVKDRCEICDGKRPCCQLNLKIHHYSCRIMMREMIDLPKDISDIVLCYMWNAFRENKRYRKQRLSSDLSLHLSLDAPLPTSREEAIHEDKEIPEERFNDCNPYPKVTKEQLDKEMDEFNELRRF